jgi:hypothetical protein
MATMFKASLVGLNPTTIYKFGALYHTWLVERLLAYLISTFCMIERSMYVSVLWGYPVYNVKIQGLRLGFRDLDPNPHLFFVGTSTRIRHWN